ncbi:MAG: hypothetical protein NW208_05325 [Bryobacter sp.]|nr:hypothetical protein [Bryobacter sp.]
MSVQIFVEGKIVAREDFLRVDAPSGGFPGRQEMIGRHLYLSLAGEVLGRALLDTLGLSHMLLGASSGEGFLVLLAEEARPTAEEFLRRANQGLAELSDGQLELHWAITENLGDWSVVRKRLFEEMQHNAGTRATADAFLPFPANNASPAAAYFQSLGEAAPNATALSLDLASPAHFQFAAMKAETAKTYSLGYQPDHLPWLPYLDLNSLDRRHAAALSIGVDSLDMRLRRAATVEDYLRLVHLYKNFFAGELQSLLMRLPDTGGKIAILDSGIDGFTVYGDLESLLKVALEMQRVFATMTDVALREDAGAEGKTLSAALVAGTETEALGEAKGALALAQATRRDSFYAFGRVLDWKQLLDALEIRSLCLKMVASHGAGPQFVADLSAFLREGAYQSLRRKTGRFEKPWRLYRRMNLALETDRVTKESEKTKRKLLLEIIGKNAGQARLRPAGRVGLELARVSLGKH